MSRQHAELCLWLEFHDAMPFFLHFFFKDTHLVDGLMVGWLSASTERNRNH